MPAHSEFPHQMDYPYVRTTQGQCISLAEFSAVIDWHREQGQRIITTNGCFDLIHPGHLLLLTQARELGDLLLVGVNSDRSVARIKGPGRPLHSEEERAEMLLALRCVDYVLVFDDLLPCNWLERVRPYRHCKAGDYSVESLPEARVVQAAGGEIAILPLREGHSTSALLGRLAFTAQSPPDNESLHEQVVELLMQHSNVLRQTAYQFAARIIEVAIRMSEANNHAHRIVFCGDDACDIDAIVFAREFSRIFQQHETDSSMRTHASSPAGIIADFEENEDFGGCGDFFCASSSGSLSKDMRTAVRQAKTRGMTVLALTGQTPCQLADRCDYVLNVPAKSPAGIRLAHYAIMLLLCQLVEQHATHRTH